MENYHLLQAEDEACWMTLRGGKLVLFSAIEEEA